MDSRGKRTLKYNTYFNYLHYTIHNTIHTYLLHKTTYIQHTKKCILSHFAVKNLLFAQGTATNDMPIFFC